MGPAKVLSVLREWLGSGTWLAQEVSSARQLWAFKSAVLKYDCVSEH